MTTTVRRATAAAAVAALLGTVGALSTAGAASASEISYDMFGGVTILLSEGDTSLSAIDANTAFREAACAGLVEAIGATLTEEGVQACGDALNVCAEDALANNRQASGVRIKLDDLSYGCVSVPGRLG